MDPATCGSEGWLRSLEEATQGRDAVAALRQLSERVRESRGARLWFVERLGRRWSHIAGTIDEEAPAAALSRVPLDERFGLVSASWGALSQDEQAALVALARRLVNQATER